VVETVECVVFN